ncbi:hypothetical protein KAH94_02485 [bacterium]|nr:hypothetical protein [bacterium]
MAKKSFSVFDFAVYGLKSTVDNFRIIFLSGLTFASTLFASLLVSGIVVRPLLMKIMKLVPLYKPQFAACKEQIVCKGIMNSLLEDVYVLATAHGLLATFVVFLNVILIFGLFLGFMRIVLDLYDNGSSSVKRLFSCFYLLPKAIVATLIFILLVFVGFLFVVVPGIYLAVRMRFFMYYLIDKNLGPIECLKKSYRATKGFGWDVFALMTLQSLLMSVLPAIGFYSGCLMMVAAYKKLPKKI